MPLRDVELALATVLQSAGHGSMEATPPTLYAGPFPSTSPDDIVAVRTAQGDGVRDYLGGGGLVPAEVQVLVRGRVREATRVRAAACWAALHQASVAGYAMVRAGGAGPTEMPRDGNGRFVFVFTVVAHYSL